jgi:hypothetical protein
MINGFVTLALCVIVAACATKSEYSPQITAVLEEAGENSSRLVAVLDHYKDYPDTLKLRAAEYLIGNMAGHSYATYALRDTLGTDIEHNVLDYESFDELLAAFDTLEQEHGVLDFERKDTIWDIHTISSDFLVDHINLAFEAWREKPWAQSLSFEEFCQYVLPYRGSNEPLEAWREKFMEQYAGIADTMVDPTDPAEAATIINKDIRTWFTFDERFYFHPTDQGLSEMEQTGIGRCEDMTNLTIFAMRANGLAVTSDYTPYWANTGNNHAWNAILLRDGEVVPFMGCERDPGDYSLPNKIAKVYRKTFGEQSGNLAFVDHKQEEVPRWLAGKSYVDVTSDYVDACDVTVNFDQPVPDSVDIAYLCVFNSGEWKAIHWGRVENGAATFDEMGFDIAYLPALYLNEEIVPFGAPFILQIDCTMLTLPAASPDNVTAQLASTTKRRRLSATDGVAQMSLRQGDSYELFFWKDGWQSMGQVSAGDQPIAYDVPSDGLFWLKPVDSDGEVERIFTVERGQQVWW